MAVPVAEPSLDGSSVLTLVGEGVAAGMAEHVDAPSVLDPRPQRRLYHAGEAGRRELSKLMG
jgi:hypothetical protein